jgi:hypothetical protein
MNASFLSFNNVRRCFSILLIVACLGLPMLSLTSSSASRMQINLDRLHLNGPEEGFGG